ncbi:RDD family protein [Phyllobacterium brassicacearum]|uniref:RDD family protein n=1 Tax=Phyllobacterium brassicacearum TaxID=314235 RepID=A0A2P7BNU0_9HYPH|nr:RDD family protein [Phyllobacterium brassicacearum]PSH68085.1 RDD family protein [Phyllobacterium brassicacearum]TDQ28351.1 putative RDD family membrane protein YckC [Phyllobacterium brassicacearum]
MNAKTLDGEIITNRLDDWRLYQGVRTSRIFAFLIDYVIVFFLCIPVAVLIAILGVATLGIGWTLYGIMFPAVALGYVATTMGGQRQATKGMQMMGLRLERLDGQKVDGLLAVVHTVLFWGLNVVLTPLILLATLFLDRKRTVHDLLLGTVVVRAYD